MGRVLRRKMKLNRVKQAGTRLERETVHGNCGIRYWQCTLTRNAAGECFRLPSGPSGGQANLSDIRDLLSSRRLPVAPPPSPTDVNRSPLKPNSFGQRTMSHSVLPAGSCAANIFKLCRVFLPPDHPLGDDALDAFVAPRDGRLPQAKTSVFPCPRNREILGQQINSLVRSWTSIEDYCTGHGRSVRQIDPLRETSPSFPIDVRNISPAPSILRGSRTSAELRPHAISTSGLGHLLHWSPFSFSG